MNYKQEIIDKIIRGFRDFEQNLKEKKRPELQKGEDWTKAVRGVFEGVTPDKYVLRQIGMGRGQGEWLWDHCWHQKDKTGCLRAVPLVVECEWGGNKRAEQKVRCSTNRL